LNGFKRRVIFYFSGSLVLAQHQVFFKKHCHVFSKKIAKSAVLTLGFKIPNFFVLEKKKKRKKEHC
jgi:hypothetical protein